MTTIRLPLHKSENLQYKLAGSMGQTTHQPSIWCSKHYFFIINIDLGHSKLLIFVFVKLQKNKKINWNDFCKELCKKLWKKNNMYLEHQKLGWSVICPSNPAYDIEDCRISSVVQGPKQSLWQHTASIRFFFIWNLR